MKLILTGFITANALSPIPAKQAISCEKSHQGTTLVDIKCEAGTKIQIEAARYGRSDKNTCPTTPGYDGLCTDTVDHSDAVREACQGKASCQYHGTNDIGGDPCAGVEKYTVIEYTCVEDKFYCDKCVGCPDGIQMVEPLGIEMFCHKGKPYLPVNPETNFAKIDPHKLDENVDAWKCVEGGSVRYSQAGSTYFSHYGVIFNDNDDAFIDTSDFTWSKSEKIKLEPHGNIIKNKIPAGSAGDCNAWTDCDLTKRGSFSVDLTNTGVNIDPNLEWKQKGWPKYMTMADYVKTDQTASARCGGWCGSCAPDTEDKNIPIKKRPITFKWYDAKEAAKTGSSWHSAVEFCATEGGQLCTFDQYCPNGVHGAPNSIIPEQTGDRWVPFGDKFNGQVQLGQWPGSNNPNAGKGCFANPFGRTWGLTDEKKYWGSGLCCAFSAPKQVYNFCDYKGETCIGQTENYYYHHLVLENSRDYKYFKFSFNQYPVRIGFGSSLSQDEISWEIGIGETDKNGKFFSTIRDGITSKPHTDIDRLEGLNKVTHKRDQISVLKSGMYVKIQNGKIWISTESNFNEAESFIHYENSEIKTNKMDNMFVSSPSKKTTWSITPVGSEEEKESKTATEQLDKYADRFVQAMMIGKVKYEKLDRMSEKLDKLTDKIKMKHSILITKCPQNKDKELIVEDEKQDRFDREDPCRGVDQLIKKIINWVGEFCDNCKAEGERKEYFTNRVTLKLNEFGEKVKSIMGHKCNSIKNKQ